MKVFFIKFLMLIVCSCLLLWSLELMQDTANKKNKFSDAYIIDKIVSGEVNADVLLLGNSRATTAFNTKIFDSITGLSCFNLGYTAGNWKAQNVYFDFYTQNNHTPKLLVQNIDLPHFSDLNLIPNLYDYAPFFNEIGEKHRYLFEKYSEYKFNWLPYFKYNNKVKINCNYLIKSISAKTKERTDFFYPYDKIFKVDYQNLVSIEKEDLEPYNTIFFENILRNQLDNSDSEILYIWLPEYYLRYELYNKNVAYLKNRIQKICSERSNCNFLDLSELDDITTSDDYFYDTFHLNTKGAQEVSVIIANYIKECYLTP